MKTNFPSELSSDECRAKELQASFRQWLGHDFGAQYFITLTADKSQSEHKNILMDMVNLFVRRLNKQLYQRQYANGNRLKICYVMETHKNGSFHCHMIIGGLSGNEHLKGLTFEQTAKLIWNTKARHKKGYAIVDITDVFDGARLYDYINKNNWRFTSEHFEYPR